MQAPSQNQQWRVGLVRPNNLSWEIDVKGFLLERSSRILNPTYLKSSKQRLPLEQNPLTLEALPFELLGLHFPI